MRKRGRRRRLDRDGRDRAALQCVEHVLQAVDVHRLVQAVVDRLADEHVVGDPDRAGEVLGTGRLIGEDGRHQVVGPHSNDLRRHFPAAGEPQDRERAGGVPAPARLEHRRGEQGLRQDVLDARRVQKLEDGVERERVLVGKRDDDAVVGRRGLQLEVERAAEPLAQRQPPRAVDARTERSVQDQLHPAALVEEALGDDGRARRDDAERGLARLHVGRRLVPRRPGRGRSRVRVARTPPRHRCGAAEFVAQARDLAREFDRAPRAPRRSRTAPTAARRARPRRAPCRPRRGGSATTSGPAGRCRRPCSRRRSLRRSCRPGCPRVRRRPRSRRGRESRRPR